MPTLDVPMFGGEIEKWASYKDRFLNLLKDNRVRDNDSTKRQCLYQSLSGEALALVENLQNVSFDKAWSVLEQAYDDPLRRGRVHYNALFNEKFPPNMRLRKLSNHFIQHIAGLESANEECGIKTSNMILINYFLDQTRDSVSLAWERALTEKRVSCKLDDFFQLSSNNIPLRKEPQNGRQHLSFHQASRQSTGLAQHRKH